MSKEVVDLMIEGGKATAGAQMGQAFGPLGINVQQIIDEINKNLTLVEKIKKFSLLNENFSIENGLLTPTMKVKRNKVIQKYKNILENFYKK